MSFTNVGILFIMSPLLILGFVAGLIYCAIGTGFTIAMRLVHLWADTNL
jgi:hypothetical protein